MWNLAIYLPLIIGDKVPTTSELWQCFLLLLDILQLCTAKICSKANASIIKALIYQYLSLFTQCFPDTPVIPKMHYMIHFPEQILRLDKFWLSNYLYIHVN